ncbi:MAG: 30S ribosomal protein S5 alanine N-acetyltransferase [Phenylobacterium zucineum]|nr:MAG: 30S ribosomal protein S5 alanine N-acetyltransferase [Phenylobacterium zucineum]
MALLDWIAAEAGLRIEGEAVYLRPPRGSDFVAWQDLRTQSRDFLQPWEPTWAGDDLTGAAYRRRLAAYQRDRETGAAYSFFVFRQADDALTGGITLSNIRRGVAQMGTLGYWCGKPYARQGLTLGAVRALTQFAFQRLDLHRLEAACVPQNTPSRRLLAQAGFIEEGEAKAYLKINGVWRDHVLFGLVSPLRSWDSRDFGFSA